MVIGVAKIERIGGQLGTEETRINRGI